ncbi:MAG: hypothetical protein IPN76_34580 [Saprospiraceae bacterium]|nr:hypothetical protein [Saprospiraceae bacterium]
MNSVLLETNPFLCQPGVVNKSPSKGVSFAYSLNPDYKMLSPDAEKPTKVRRNERYESRLKVPVLYHPQLKIMMGLDYTLERYHFLNIDPDNYPLFEHLNETDLKNAGISANFFHPINHKYYTSLRLSANWQGDFNGFISMDDRYAVYRITALIGVKKRDDLEYGAGLLLNKGFRGNSIVPFGFYNQTFNDYWGVEAVLPTSIKFRYNFSESRLAMFGTEFTSQNYALNVMVPGQTTNQTKDALYHFRRASIDVVGTFYQRLSGWTWLQFKAGYAFDNNSDARDLLSNLNHRLKPSGSVIGMVSFFISPPKQCVDKPVTQVPANL